MATTKGSRSTKKATRSRAGAAHKPRSNRKTLNTELRPRSLALAVGAALLPWGTAHALPTGENVVAGDVTVTRPTSQSMQINQATQKGIVNWNSFSIRPTEHVNITQQNASSVLLNRVVGNNPSEIFGRLTANGQVFLVNPNGVLFAPGASVDVGALFASTLSISNQDFLAGRYQFSREGNAGSVVNQGTIVTANGYTALVGPQVRNDGVIIARKGTVALAAADRVSLDMIGDGLISLNVDQAALNASVINTGRIEADGGRVLLTARSANALFDTVINTTGVIRANSLVERNGEIVLDGGGTGIVAVSGSLQAAGVESGTTGGTIKVLGEYVGLLEGTRINASGDAGGGTVLIGGNYQGQGPEHNASQTVVSRDAIINADAVRTGDGGTVIVWSDDGTRFYGTVSARGGATSGNGGFVEVSGKDGLIYRGKVDLRAPHGATGTLLLDPDDITVVNGDIGDSIDGGFTGVDPRTFNPDGVGPSTVTDGDINDALTGAHVIITTTSGGTGDGDITFNAAAGRIDFVSLGNRLTFDATRNISFINGTGGENTTADLGGAQLALRAGTGSITQATANDTLALTNTPLVMIAATGIFGSTIASPFITIGMTSVAATTGTGGIFLQNTGSTVTVNSITATDLGATVVNGLSTTTSGDILVSTSGDLSVNAQVNANAGTDDVSLSFGQAGGGATFTLTATGSLIGGTNTVAGGAGADTFDLNAALVTTATLNGNGGTDSVLLTADSDITLADTSLTTTSGFSLTLSSVESATLTGGAGANVIDASAFTLGPVTLIGLGDADTLTGGSGNDTLIGGAGTDTLNGGAGNDIYIIASAADHPAAEIADTGGTADEVRFTSTAAETLTIFAGDTGLEIVRISDAAGVTTGTTAENINASAAPNGLQIIGNDGANTLTGTAFADTINGNGGVDTIAGGAGIDIITGGAGTDVLDGGADDDIYIIASAADHPAAEITDTGGTADEVRFTSTAAGTLTIFAGDTGLEIVRISDAAGVTTGTTAENINASAAPNGLTIVGNDGANTLTGTAFVDTINGNGGADTITGGASTDILNGGAGDDIYIIAAAADHAAAEIADTAGTADEVRFTSTAAETLTIFAGDTGLEIVRISDAAGVTTGTTAENINASAAPNGLTIVGNDGANTLTGTAFADTINGNGGVDTIAGGAGIDIITGGAGTDVLDGGADDDIYIIASAADHPAAEITDTGGTADEVRFTSTAAETLTIFAGDTGLEIVRISDAAGVTTGTTAENINASAAPNGLTIVGNDGANTLTGTAFADTINGNGGVDTIAGGAGIDIITGGAGTDVLDGGADDDIYIIASAADHPAAEITDTGGTADEVRFTSTAAETLTIFAGDTGLEIVRISDAAGVSTGTTAENINASAAPNGLQIIGNDGANTLVGTAFVDTINGNGGVDTITGGASTDILNGGAGDDIYIIAAAADHAAAEIADTAGTADEVRFTSTAAETLTIFAGDTGLEIVRISDAAGVTTGTTAENINASAAPNGLTIVGNDGANTLTGTAFVDTINGNGGADTITGGASTDILNGGAGDDIYIIAAAADHAAAEIADTAGTADEVRFTSTAAETLTIFAGDTGLEIVRISDAAGVTTGTTAENINASAAPNGLTIVGNDGANTLVGTAFVDTINGNGGVDTITGGASTDILNGGAGDDIYIIAAAADHAAAEIADTAGTADEVRFTSTAAETLTIFAGDTGLEIVRISDAAGVTTGTTAENINASAAPNGLTIVGNDGANTLTGTAFADTINGNGGVDTIAGGAGIDIITGGAGTDVLDGGADDDIYIIASAADHPAAEITDTGGTADEVRFTSTAAETLTIFAGDTGLEIVRISDAAGVSTGTTAENINASAAPNGLQIIGNDGANTLVGTAFVDTINGNGGVDTITGGASTDILNGGAGDDIYIIAAAADHAAAEIADTAGTADEVRFTSTAAETLTIFAGDTGLEIVRISDAAGVTTGTTAENINASAAPNGLTIVGNDGANTLTGTAFVDTINGNGGADTITGGASTDILNGGAGDDIYIIAAAADHAAAEIADTAGTADEVRFTSTAAETLTIFAGDTGLEIVRISDAAGVTTGTTAENINASAAPNGLQIIGNDGANTLTGTAFADTINGNGGVDTIAGGAGIDIITGGAGTDVLDGGADDDIYIIASAADHPAAEITDTGGTADEVRFTSTAAETLTIFAGDTGLEIVRISDAAGVTTGTTAENINASAAPNGLTIVGNDGANTLVGTAFVDTINGNGGVDTITGGASTDILNGGAGDDIYIIAAAADHAAAEIADTAGAADEVRFTSTAAETLTIFAGDTGLEIVRISDAAGVTTGTTAENINASAAPNGLTIVGNDGANTLVGTAFVDTINGNGGVDTITGGASTDILNGGAGDDIYIIAAAADHAAAEIADTAGTADEVRFTSTAAGTLTIFAGDTGLEIVRISDAAGVTTGTTAENINASAAPNGLTIVGNDGANTLVGTAFVDTINGNGGVDTITGGASTDILNGGAGDDIYIIAAAADHAAAEIADTAGAADEVRFTSTAAETLTIFAGDTGLEIVRISDAAGVTTGTTAENINASAAPNGLTIVGNDGANTLVGTAFVDTINGNGGVDTITGGASTDILNGGAGDDIYIIAAAADHAAAEIADTAGTADEVRFTSTAAGTLTIFAGDTGLEIVRISDAAGVTTGTTAENINASAAPNGLTIVGNDGANTLVGTAFVDTINGNGGVDTITGGASTDILNGGAGDDIYIIAAAADHAAAEIADTAGAADEVRFTSTAAETLTIFAGDTGLEIVRISDAAGVTTGTTAENINASAAPNGLTIVGNDGANTLTGTAFADTINGNGGVDTIAGGAGIDIITGGAGTDVLDGGADDDIYIIASAADHPAAEITDTGGTADEVRFTSTAAETLTIFAGDTGLEIVRISDAAGVSTGTTAENINASAAPNGLQIIGNDGANTLVGTAFVDTINGNGGVDTITGGASTDILNGGAGDDIYIIAAAADHAAAEIADTAGTADEVRFTSTAAETLTIFAGDTGLEIVRISDAAGVTTGTTAENINASAAPNGLTIVGNDGANTLVGTAFVDTINGNGGVDTITGGASTDILNGGAGDDIYIIAAAADHAAAEIADTAGTADEVRFTSTAAETLTIFAGDTGLEIVRISDAAGVTTGTTAENINASAAPNGLTIVGNDGANTLVGTAFVDTINGNGGVDTITGGASTDILNGGAGDDIYIIAAAADHAAAEIADTAGTADEVRFTSTAAETLTIFAGDTGLEIVRISDAAGVTTGTTAENINASAAPNGLTIVGNDGANTLVGTAFVDTINGNGGVDTITGGASTDILNGGAGDDIYIIAAAADHAAAEIADTAGTADEVRFTSTAAETLTIFAGDTGLEIVRISDAAGVTTGTTAENINASAAPNGLTIVGNDGANTLVGTAFVDTINGNGGVDTITGGASTDILNGGASDDIYIIAAAADHAAAEIADTAGAADEVRFTSTAAETLTIFAGDTGLEIVRISDAAGVTTGTTAENINASAAPNGLTIVGNDGANTLVGTAFVDTINGNGGADTITGGASTDILNGGAGDDIYIIAAAADHAAAEIADTAGAADEVRFTSTAAETLTIFAGDTGLEIVRISDAAGVTTGTTAENINASAAPNGLQIIGNDGANTLVGTAFVDTINGNGGNDTVTGGAGADILNGGAGAADVVAETRDANFTITNTALTIGAEGTDTLSGIEVANLTGGTGNNTFTLSGWTGSGAIVGGGGADTLVGQDIVNVWTINASGNGNINGTITFSAMTNLTGGTLADNFEFTSGGGVTGTVNGGAGINTLDYDTQNFNLAVTVTLTDLGAAVGFTGTANGTGGFDNITAVRGDAGFSATNVLAGRNAAADWTTTTTDSGLYESGGNTLQISSFGNWSGGNNVDTFNLTNNVVNVAGNAGNDVFNVNGSLTAGLSGGADADTFNIGNTFLLNGTAAGGAGSDTLNLGTWVASTNVTLTASGTDGYAGDVAGGIAAFTDIDVLTGGSGNNTLTGIGAAATWTTSGTNAGTYQQGTPTLTFSNFANWTGGSDVDTFNLGHNLGTVLGLAGNDVFNVNASLSAALQGGANNDSFNFANNAALTGSINGGADLDTLNLSAYTTAVTFSLTSAGGSGANGSTTGTPNPISGGFTDIDTISAGTNNDVFNINASVTANLNGNGGADSFIFQNGLVLTGTLSGGADSDTLNLSAYAAATDVTLSAVVANGYSGTATGIATFDTIDVLMGGSGTNTLTGLSAAATWSTSATNAGTYTSGSPTLTFSSFANWTGGSLADTFNLSHTVTGTVTGSAGTDTFNYNAGTIGALTGGTDSDTLVGPAAGTTFLVTAADGGTVGTQAFTSMENLTGGAGNDTFQLTTGTLTGAINGGAGSDTLIAANVANTWTITGTNSGTLTGVGTGWASIENLQGGTGTDSFTGAGGSVAGSITDGGGGATTLSGGITSGGAQTYTAAVTLGGGTALSSGSTVSFGSSVAGPFALSITATTIDLNDVTTTGAQTYNGSTNMGGNYVTNGGSFTVNGATTLDDNSTVTAGGGSVTFNGTVNADANTGDGQETLTTSGGNTTFAGAIGGSQALGGLNVTATGALTLPSTNIAGDLSVVTTSDITQTGAVIVTGTTNLQAGGGSVFMTLGSNDFVGVVTAGGTGGIDLVDVNTLTLGAVNAGSGEINLTANAIAGVGPVDGGIGVFNSNTNVVGLVTHMSGQLAVTGNATLWNFGAGSTANPFARTAETISVQVNGATQLANLVQLQTQAVIGDIAAQVGATIVEEANKTFGTDSVSEDVEYGFAGEIGATPPMDHRIDESGISLPACVQESRDGVPCK